MTDLNLQSSETKKYELVFNNLKAMIYTASIFALYNPDIDSVLGTEMSNHLSAFVPFQIESARFLPVFSMIVSN